MTDLREYTNRFFSELEVFEDLERGHSYKIYLHQAVLEFIADSTKQNAFAVYEAFFDSYRIVLDGETNPFLDLLDALRRYEENAAVLVQKQRDHFIHSVNVFLVGLAIYIQNSSFRSAFQIAVMDQSIYPFSYSTRHEEFFYRWGIASLFHDVGYPIEIIDKQFQEFVDFTAGVDSPVEIKSHLAFDNFEDLNHITEIIPRQEFERAFQEQFSQRAELDCFRPLDLLAGKLHLSLGLDLTDIKSALDGFLPTMAEQGFIDHGFFSALIVLRWYGYLIQICRYKADYFFQPILDSASAILLHNYYRNVITKPPFNLGPLAPERHPIAFLLMLCDELQEWDRHPYGRLDRLRTQIQEADLKVSDDALQIAYLADASHLPADLAEKKEGFLLHLLDLEYIFKKGIHIEIRNSGKLQDLPMSSQQDHSLVPRPLLENLEQLAKAIHELYNQKQLERYPDRPLSHPSFDDLPEGLKYSNLRQARGIYKKIALLDLSLEPAGSPGQVVREFPPEVVERLAKIEHQDWMEERIQSGWVYGQEKDPELKVSPYLVPYRRLPEEIKERDRDTIRNIPLLLEMIGLALYQRD